MALQLLWWPFNMNTNNTTQTEVNLTAISNETLLSKTQELAISERRITLQILHHLKEIERRRAFAKIGYSSLWEYVIQELKYSESAAYRRISAMRAIKEHPELEKNIETGTLSVSAVSQVHKFFNQEQYQAGKTYTKTEKINLYKKCENKSAREVMRELIKISPLALRVQKERDLTENHTEIRFVADSLLLKKIHRVRDLSASRLNDPASYPELVNLMSDVTLNEIDPLQKPDKSVALITSQPTQLLKNLSDDGKKKDSKSTTQNNTTTNTINSRPLNHSRYIPTQVRTQVWKESGGRCTYVYEKTKKRCDSTFGLEIEHCKPHSLGGSSSDIKNLRLLCKAHNQWQAIKTYGLQKMQEYL